MPFAREPAAGSRMGRLPEANTSQSRLRESVVFVGLDRVVIRLVYHTAQADIVAEVGASDRLPLVSRDLVGVRLVNRAITVHVADEEAERHIRRPATTVSTRNPDGHDLNISHASERDPYFVTTEGRCACRGRAADDLGITRGNCGVEGKDGQVAACVTIFHARGAGERHASIEAASWTIGQTRGRAHQVSSTTRRGWFPIDEGILLGTAGDGVAPVHPCMDVLGEHRGAVVVVARIFRYDA